MPAFAAADADATSAQWQQAKQLEKATRAVIAAARAPLQRRHGVLRPSVCPACKRRPAIMNNAVKISAQQVQARRRLHNTIHDIEISRHMLNRPVPPRKKGCIDKSSMKLSPRHAIIRDIVTSPFALRSPPSRRHRWPRPPRRRLTLCMSHHVAVRRRDTRYFL